MTKTEARQLAQRARSYGHYHALGSLVYGVDCPRCRVRVETQRSYRYVPAPKGQPYVIVPGVLDGRPVQWRQETTGQALDRAMVDHLTEGWCEA